MPVQRCTKGGESGWRWGESGVCFVGPDARERAEAVGRAIHARQDYADHVEAMAWYVRQDAVHRRAVCTPCSTSGHLHLVRRVDAPEHPAAAAQPMALEARYRGQLLRRTRQVHKLLMGAMQAGIASVATEMNERARSDSAADVRRRLLAIIDRIERAVASASPIDPAPLARLGRDVVRFTTRAVDRQVQTVVAIEVADTLTDADKMLARWVAANVELIESLDGRYFDDIRREVREAVEVGRSTRVLSSRLQARLGVSQSRADLIAVDQVSSLNAQITQERQTQLGISEYIWSNAGDNRVRPKHQDAPVGLGGTRRRWDKPHPTEGHPGQPIRCRCVAIPVIE